MMRAHPGARPPGDRPIQPQQAPHARRRAIRPDHQAAALLVPMHAHADNPAAAHDHVVDGAAVLDQHPRGLARRAPESGVEDATPLRQTG